MLREDSIKLFSNLSHPRTVQKYDKEVLAKDWDCKLKEVLALESEKFQELKIAEINLESLLQDLDVDAIAASVEELKQNLPKQVQVVWDNLNLRTKPRFQRQRDTYEDYNLDWMASLLIQERISANHMEHVPGRALKDPESLSIQDFVPQNKRRITCSPAWFTTTHSGWFHVIHWFSKPSTHALRYLLVIDQLSTQCNSTQLSE